MSGNEIRFHIADNTIIANILLKQLFSHIETKQQLTVYLSEYVSSKFEQLGRDYVVSYDSVSKTNQEGLLAEIPHHLHEEADTISIIHCREIAKRIPSNQCIVY